ncbi:hypothetical protein QKW52_21770 [Bacillus sonorensis]|nr:hypothetical protein [Bacillus sonorensis]
MNNKHPSSTYQSLKQALKEMNLMREGRMEKRIYEEMKQQMKKKWLRGGYNPLFPSTELQNYLNYTPHLSVGVLSYVDYLLLRLIIR